PRRIAGAAAAVAARESFPDHLRTYLAVITMLVVIWALTGAGFPWPVFPAMGWGIGVLSHWSAARRAPRAQLHAPHA
ncbi:MAG TPA: 2TM domain-containing protein, partial [Solirubrobacteraceae bacterium]|nr:2TM domain-containing protein [Solirubrobacteraceae bacterium]